MTQYFSTSTFSQFVKIVCLFFAFCTPQFIDAQSCTNLLTNPSFENGLNGWSTTGDVTISTDAFSGTQAAEICGPAGSVSQIVVATPGETYTASIWGKLDGIPSYQTSTFRFLDASYAPIPGGSVAFGFPSETEFTLREYSAVAPPNAAYAHLLVYKESGGCVIVDEGEICMGTTNPNGEVSILCPAGNFSYTVPSGSSGAVSNYAQPTVSTTCPSGGETFTMTSGLPSGSLFPIGTTEVCFEATDDCGNLDDCCFTVTVTEDAPPPSELVISNVDCPISFPKPDETVTWEVEVKNEGSSNSLPTPLYLYNFAPGVLGYVSTEYGNEEVPTLAPGEITTVVFNVPPSVHSPNPNFGSYGEDFILTGEKGLSFFPIASGNAPEYTEADGFPNIYCKKFSTDIEVNLTTAMTEVAPDEPVVFTMTVTNNGLEDAHNILSLMNSYNTSQPYPLGHSVELETGNIWERTQAAGGGTNTFIEYWHIPFLAAGEATSAIVTITPVPIYNEWTPPFAAFLRGADSSHNTDSDPSNNSDNFLLPVSGGPGDLIDLELGLAQPNADPAQWSSYPVTATLTNNGDAVATGVKVDFAKPIGVVYTGGNEYNASQGSFNPNGNEVWTVGNLAPGVSATLEVSYFLLASASPVAWAEVSAANETDVDSTPGNGISPEENEDDEASTDGGSGIISDLSISNILPITGTVMPGDNLTGGFSAYYAGTYASVNFKYAAYLSDDPVLSPDDYFINNQYYQVTSMPNGVYTPFQVNFTMPSGLPDGQIYFIAVLDPTDELAETDETNNVGFNSFLLDNGTVCNISASVSNIQCSDNGTPNDPLDDTFTADVTVTNPGGGTGFVPASLFGCLIDSGDYGVTYQFGPNIISGFGMDCSVASIRDNQNPACQTTYAIVAPPACSNGIPQPDLTLSNLNIQNSPIEAGEILNYTFDISNIGNADAPGNFNVKAWISIDQTISPDDIQDGIVPTGNYAAGLTQTGIPGASTIPSGLADGQYFLILKVDADDDISEGNEGNNEIAAPFSVAGSLSCTGDVVLVSCDDDGTPNDPSDDQFYFSINMGISTTPPVTTWGTVINGESITGTFGIPRGLGPYPIADGPINFTVTGFLCSLPLTAIPPPPCSNNLNGDIDLAISLSANPTDPAIYSNTEVTLLITNSGAEAATGVVVEFFKPNGTVYTGGNEWSATQGTFIPFGPERWEVGSIPAGGTATLTVSYFMLTANALTPYAQVIAANETDADSTPGNGTCCTPNEDDEATLTLNGFAGGGGISLNRPDMVGRDVQLRSINPNPIYFGEAKVTLDSRVEGWFELETYDVFGRLAASQKVELREGRNEITLDVSEFRSGTYYLNMPGQNWRNMPLRFIVAKY